MRASRSEELRAFRGVRRACHAGLDSVTLRKEVVRRIASVIPFEAHNFATTDPDTGLLTHGVAHGLPPRLFAEWIQWHYPFGVAAEVMDAAGGMGPTVTTANSATVSDLLHPEGLRHHVRSVCAERGDPWGFLCLLRDGAAHEFSPREIAFLKRAMPHLTQALRTAALVESGLAIMAPGDDGGPGVIVMDPFGRVMTNNPANSRYLRDLRDEGVDENSIPFSVCGAVAKVTRSHADSASNPGGSLTGELLAKGRSGRWYVIRACLAEPDADGNGATIVLIEQAARPVLAPILTRLYGLTPREREVLSLAMKGRSTKRIALELGVSPYTVQEHLGNACAKVGVRTRKELIAKLFVDGYAHRVMNGAR